jgi:lactose/raffinose/galactose permease
MISKNKLKTRLAYSAGLYGHDTFFATLSTYFIVFLTSKFFAGLDNERQMIGFVTLLVMIIRIVELLIDPLIGGIIDNTKSKIGKFKPWILLGGFTGSVCLIILFTGFGNLSQSKPFLFLLLFGIVYIVMDIMYSFKDIGIWSMIPALSLDTKERETLGTFARVGASLGATVTQILVVPVVLFFSFAKNNGGSSDYGSLGDKHGWLIFAIFVGIVSFLGAVVVAFGTKENDSLIRKQEHTNLKQVFKAIFNNDQLMWIAFAYVFFSLANNISNAFQIYYFEYVYGDATKFATAGIVTTIIGVIAAISFPQLTKAFKRRNVYVIGGITMIISYLIFFFAGHNLPVVLIGVAFLYFPQPIIFLVVLMTISDAVEYGQLKLGRRNESVALSVRPLIDKLSSAVTNGLIGITVTACGMFGNATAIDITQGNILKFKVIMAVIPATFCVVSMGIFLKKVTLNEFNHKQIVEKLEKNLLRKTK